MRPIGESTAVTLGAVVVIIAVAAWMTTIAAKGDAMEARLGRVDAMVQEDHNQLYEQRGDLKAIREIVERIDKRNDE